MNLQMHTIDQKGQVGNTYMGYFRINIIQDLFEDICCI